jgi:hypothetical protein
MKIFVQNQGMRKFFKKILVITPEACFRIQDSKNRRLCQFNNFFLMSKSYHLYS